MNTPSCWQSGFVCPCRLLNVCHDSVGLHPRDKRREKLHKLSLAKLTNIFISEE